MGGAGRASRPRTRVAVFVDYEDMCRTGHQAFAAIAADGPETPAAIDPVCLAEHVVRRRDRATVPTTVRVYRAVPDGRVDEPAFSATLWQIERWSRAGAVVVRRSLRDLGPGDVGRERGRKALVVAMAIDLVVMAWRDQYDLAVVCSSDPDLGPAVRSVLELTWKAVDVAAWCHPNRPGSRLSIPGEQVTCHWLDEAVYEDVLDRGGRGGAERAPA